MTICANWVAEVTSSTFTSLLSLELHEAIFAYLKLPKSRQRRFLSATQLRHNLAYDPVQPVGRLALALTGLPDQLRNFGLLHADFNVTTGPLPDRTGLGRGGAKLLKKCRFAVA